MGTVERSDEPVKRSMLRLLEVWNRIRGDSLTMSVIVGA
jgi:hypothetical protein